MRLHVAQELRQPVGTQVSFDLREGNVFLDDDAILSDLSGTVTLLRTDCGLLVSVRATCSVRETCSRCLAEVHCPLTINFQEEYLPAADPTTGAPLHLTDTDDSFRIGADFMLDLGEALRQYKLMSDPAKPLCRPNCAGLCPHCGTNLNEAPCPCPPTTSSPLARALATLKAISDDEGS